MKKRKVSVPQNLYPMDASFYQNLHCDKYPIFQLSILRNQSFSFPQKKNYSRSTHDCRSKNETRLKPVKSGNTFSLERPIRTEGAVSNSFCESQPQLIQKRTRVSIRASMNKMVNKKYLSNSESSTHYLRSEMKDKRNSNPSMRT